VLFTSPEFAFVFLPATLLAFFLLATRWCRGAALLLAIASVVFYAWWNYRYVPLLILSAGGNFLISRILARLAREDLRTRLLALGILLNILTLAVYKYLGFLTRNLNIIGLHVPIIELELPLGISFFTFTQIAFLVDVRQRKAVEANPVHYGLFVTYFPHLIAGPILHHSEMMPQFARQDTYRPQLRNILLGLSIFVIGLVKKVIFADGIELYVAPVFDQPGVLHFGEAWLGALAYTVELYFDFSGYSDMAIGLSKLFNIDLPYNFSSPYKSRNIIEFWRRWHMTLSRFLRDYVYVPLGGNRRGKVRRYLNLFVTMLLGGFWHGAGWTFIAWGALHGFYLLVAHGFDGLVARLGLVGTSQTLPWRFLAGLLTFVAVVVAWVFFRSADLVHAGSILRAMVSVDEVGGAAWSDRFVDGRGPALICILLVVAFLAPNSQQIVFGRFESALGRLGRLHASALSWFCIGALSTLATFLIVLSSSKNASPFIYFNF
jgi:alginate O-acetyltransferase complex protein AlgI